MNHYIDTPHGPIYAKEYIPTILNSNIPIILLHDSLGSVDQWRTFPELIANSSARRVIAYDRLGFGKSASRIEPLSPTFIHEEAEMFFPLIIKFFNIEPFIVMGHSVGGGMAVTIASGNPNCLGLISISAQAFIEKTTLDGIRSAKKVFKDINQMKRLEKWHGLKAPWVLNAWTETWLSEDFQSWSLSDVISGVNCPSLVVHGDQDEYGSTAFPEFIANKSNGDSQLVIIKNCGHMPHKEHTSTVIEHMSTFLSSLE